LGGVTLTAHLTPGHTKGCICTSVSVNRLSAVSWRQAAGGRKTCSNLNRCRSGRRTPAYPAWVSLPRTRPSLAC
jgi:hypothetical protein